MLHRILAAPALVCAMHMSGFLSALVRLRWRLQHAPKVRVLLFIFRIVALVLAGLHVPAFAAGQWPQARSQQMGDNGRPAAGLRAYFFAAGTSTPLTTYTDYSLAVPNAAYVETDATGRFPAVYFDEADAFYRVRVTTAGGVVIYDDDAVPVIGPTEGGGGAEVPVDPNALLATGDTKTRYGTGVIAGFVRLNGRTIGSATSGASERASADTQELFEYLWLADSTLAVSGGRGVSATADFEANKTIALPDFRGRGLFALDDMGNSAAGVMAGLTTLGEVMGGTSFTLSAANIPQLTSSSNGDHTHTEIRPNLTSSFDNGAGNETGASSISTVNTSSGGVHTHTVGNASPAAVTGIVPPLVGITVYIKL